MAQQPSRAKAPLPDLGKGSLRVGRLTKPHGLKGGLKVELYTDNPDERFVAGALFHLQVPEESPWFGRTLTVRELRWFNGVPVCFFEEVADRNDSESIVRAILWIDEATVEQSVEDNAWYDHQLIGLEVRRDGALVGTVSEVQHFPAQDLLSVKTPSGVVLVPFVEAIVPSVDLEAGIVTVTPPAGLFEEIADEDGGEAAEAAASAAEEVTASDATEATDAH